MDAKENFSILIVDDDPTVIRVLRSMLAEFTPLRFAASAKDALVLARKSTPDLVLLDVEMPGLSGFEVCKAFKADTSLAKVPIIFVTSHESAELQTAGLRLGAADFITKPPNAALVLARVRAQMGTKRLSDTLRSAVTLDFLTGTSNRLHFEKALQQEWLRARRGGTSLCLVLMRINDFENYSAVDEASESALRAVADALRSVIKRPADLLARYAAGTFVALLPETDLAGAKVVARRAIEAVAELAISSVTPQTQLTLSVGIAHSSTVSDVPAAVSIHNSKEGLMAAAEKALAAAQAGGRRELVGLELGHLRLQNA